MWDLSGLKKEKIIKFFLTSDKSEESAPSVAVDAWPWRSHTAPGAVGTAHHSVREPSAASTSRARWAWFRLRRSKARRWCLFTLSAAGAMMLFRTLPDAKSRTLAVDLPTALRSPSPRSGGAGAMMLFRTLPDEKSRTLAVDLPTALQCSLPRGPSRRRGCRPLHAHAPPGRFQL